MNVWINLAYQFLRRAFANPTLWAWIEGNVEQAAQQADRSGSAKRRWVDERRAAMPHAPRTALSALASWLVNLAIEAMVAKLKVAKGV